MKSGMLVASCVVLMVGIVLSNTYISVSAELEAEAEVDGGDYYYCGNKCKVRCARAGVLDRCLKYCGICCAKCKCVPEGTYGNKHQCPCYRDMVNSKGKPKCP